LGARKSLIGSVREAKKSREGARRNKRCFLPLGEGGKNYKENRCKNGTPHIRSTPQAAGLVGGEPD